MTLTLSPELEAALTERSQAQRLPPEQIVVGILKSALLPQPSLPEPRDDWERRLLSLGIDCGVSLSNEAVSREGIYE